MYIKDGKWTGSKCYWIKNQIEHFHIQHSIWCKSYNIVQHLLLEILNTVKPSVLYGQCHSHMLTGILPHLLGNLNCDWTLQQDLAPFDKLYTNYQLFYWLRLMSLLLNDFAAIKNRTSWLIQISTYNTIVNLILHLILSQDKDRFDGHYSSFQRIVGDLEKFLASYLHVIFNRKMKTQQGLDIVTR